MINLELTDIEVIAVREGLMRENDRLETTLADPEAVQRRERHGTNSQYMASANRIIECNNRILSRLPAP